MKKFGLIKKVKENKGFTVLLFAGGFITGTMFLSISQDVISMEEYKTLVEEHNINVDDYNSLLEEYNILKEDTSEWISMSEEDKEAFRNMTEEQKAQIEQQRSEREKKEEEARLEEQRKATEGVNIYEDSKVKINYLKSTHQGMVFLVENKTDKTLTIQADSVAINGYSTDSIVMSDDVSPQSKGKVIARCSLEEYEAKTVSGQLRVVDFDTWDSYNATFTNVNVE